MSPDRTLARPAVPGEGPRTRAGVRRYAVLVGGCLALSWVVSFGWWLLLPGARTVEVVIPSGTAAALAAGRRDAAVPDRLELRRGDMLVVRNEDRAVHRVGSSTIAPGHTERIPVTRSLLDPSGLLCSFHPSGSIGVAPPARPGIERTLLPAALAGVPLSLVLVFAVVVADRLGMDGGDTGVGARGPDADVGAPNG